MNEIVPSFDFPAGAVLLVLSRGLFVAATMLCYGTAMLRCRVAGPALRAMPAALAQLVIKRYRILGLSAASGAVAAAIFWLAVETHAMAETQGLTATIREMPSVLFGSGFGHTLMLQVIALLAAAALFAFRKPSAETFAFAAFFAGCALAGQGWQGHAASMYEGVSPLLVSEIAHLLAAGAWLGSLPALLMLVRLAPPAAGAIAARRFAPYGTWCVLTLAVTAFFQGRGLIGSVPGLFGTGYGWMALSKLSLFLILIGFAALNRYRLTPRQAKNSLARSITLETVFGIIIIFSASMLLQLPPSIHEQTKWPFPWQFSLATLDEDPSFKTEALYASLALAGAGVLIVAGVLVRRLRYPALVIVGVVAWFAIPHLDLLFIEAHPTSFYRSPTGFAVASIDAGQKLYAANCAMCHGPKGRGDGPEADDLAVPPADLTAGHLWAHSDGELFWWLTDGIAPPDDPKARVMPAFAGALSEQERWQLIDFIRARNAGLAHAATAEWPAPLHAPAFEADCGPAGKVTMDTLQGRAALIVFGDDASVPALPSQEASARLVTISVGSQAKPGSSSCVANDLQIAKAYATISGLPPEKIAGTRFLVDPNGWLRAMQPPGGTEWQNSQTLLAKIEDIRSHPLANPESGHAHHHHH